MANHRATLPHTSTEAADRRPAARHVAPASRPPRVLVVDDFPSSRAGIRVLLAEAMPIEFVGEAGDVQAAMALARRLEPDLVLLEVAMHGGAGLEVLRRLRLELPASRVLAITISQELGLVAEAVRAGAHGYLIKTADQDALVDAVQRVLAGQLAIDPALAMQALRASSGRDAATDTMPEPLTPREVDVLRLVSRGHTNSEIARKLLVAAGTVKIHVEHILAKLGAAGRTDAAVRAQQLGLLDPPPGEAVFPERHMPVGR